MSDLGIAIAGVALAGVAIILIVILFVIVLLLYRRTKRLERRLGRKSVRDNGVAEKRPLELSPVRQGVERKSSIPTPKLSRPVNTPDSNHSYENTKLVESMDQPPRKNTGEISGNYTVVPDSLPAFLRTDDMLMVPKVDNDTVKSAQKDFDESYARLSMIRTDYPPVCDDDDYMDPQDARDVSSITKTHDKLDKRVSRNKHGSDGGSTVSSSSTVESSKKLISMSNREDYSMVSDALPDGSFAKVKGAGGTPEGHRTRTTSDTSPVKKQKRNPSLARKSESMKRPGHVDQSKSQPLKRRSTAKEMVTFDPKAGFKLTAKRTVSDGTPQLSKVEDSQLESNSAPHSPVEEKKGAVLADVGGRHVYAAVDLTAKCRPETDIIRREGVGTPDHYVACM